MAHAIMHVGTTVDTFLRNNLDWYGYKAFTLIYPIQHIHVKRTLIAKIV